MGTSPPEIARHYAHMNIVTSAMPRVIYLLHERCLLLIQKSLHSEQPQRQYLDKAQNIIVELERALKIEDSIAESMFYLYDYCYVRLDSMDSSEHEHALAIMKDLRNTFYSLLNPLAAMI